MIAGDEPRGAGADAVALDRLDGGVLERRMLGQAEVVVAGERQQPPAVALHPDARHAGRCRPARGAGAPFQLAELLRCEFIERAHVCIDLSVLRGQNGGNEPRMEALNGSQDIKQSSRRGARVVRGRARPCLAALCADEDGAAAAAGGRARRAAASCWPTAAN